MLNLMPEVPAYEAYVRENADRLTSCLVLATESDEPVPTEAGAGGLTDRVEA